MNEYRLSGAAKADIRSIYSSTEQKFGTYQAHAYAEGLRRTFLLLADFTLMGRAADDLWVGLRSFGYQSHMIFYTVATDHIVIRRVLHARMDFRRQIPPSDSKG